MAHMGQQFLGRAAARDPLVAHDLRGRGALLRPHVQDGAQQRLARLGDGGPWLRVEGGEVALLHGIEELLPRAVASQRVHARHEHAAHYACSGRGLGLGLGLGMGIGFGFGSGSGLGLGLGLGLGFGLRLGLGFGSRVRVKD